ncbi:MAG: hypothetical protein ACLRFF_04335 [Alphaproteobacteria bacterium]
MFNNASIVSTAVSSFNNAALYGPYFFVVALFSIPLFFMVFLYGRNFISRFGWEKSEFESKIGFWSIASLAVWLLLIGGNYAVIRDSISLLPVMISVVLFGATVFITNRLKKLNYLKRIYNKKSRWFVFFLLLILAGFSAMPSWWGILLQLSAIVCGMIVGDRLHRNISDVLVSLIIFGTTTVLLLMQPEYFRFGQLGNLTFVHLLALLITGFFCVTAFAAKYTNAREKIYKSAYIKLKWLFRIMSVLALILFVLTESVPVFVGLMGVCALSEMMTIYHGKGIPEHVFKQSWALLMICFGIITICPLITMLGMVYLTCVAPKINLKDFMRLL